MCHVNLIEVHYVRGPRWVNALPKHQADAYINIKFMIFAPPPSLLCGGSIISLLFTSRCTTEINRGKVTGVKFVVRLLFKGVETFVPRAFRSSIANKLGFPLCEMFSSNCL